MDNKIYNYSIVELLDKLKVDLKRGLTPNQVNRRLNDFGANQLPQKKENSILDLWLAHFKDFMVLVLVVAVIVSGALGELADAAAIFAIVILNAVMGFVQEFRAEKSLQALKKLSAPQAKVKRDGQIQEIPAQDVVPGDLVIVELGDKIPADARVVESNNLKVNEASLTGESTAVLKKDITLAGEVSLGDRSNMLHLGTTVVEGRGKAVVTDTGIATEMGQIADLLQQEGKKLTPLQRRLKTLSKWIVFSCLLACLAVMGLGVLRGESIYRMFLSGVSLAVAAIPEGLPAIVTLVLALGVQRLIKCNAVVRKLPAVETLGCATVICSDKTGTLTTNEMVVEQIYVNNKIYYGQAEGFSNPALKKILEISALCNNAEIERKRSKDKIIGDPTEGALLLAAQEAGINREKLAQKYQQLLEIPFSSKRKRMSVIAQGQNKAELLIKGAPEVILERSQYYYQRGKVKKLTAKKKGEILEQNQSFAEQALRVLGVGYRELSGVLEEDDLAQYEEEIIFVGLMGLIDPPRPETKKAILECKKAGIKAKMITGDHKETAVAIAKKLNLKVQADRVITGDELQELSEQELVERIADLTVLARVSPEDKLRIVKALQKKEHIVAMTGDGVNDAPAIKEADIGIAMGQKGTDVTKEASSLILADDNFATIVAAVAEGRGIYNNIRKFIRYLLSCNVGEILTMFFSSLLALPLPLVAIQILWVNLVTDGLPALALGVDPADDDIMEQPPRSPQESIFSGGLQWKILGQGLLIGLSTLFVFLLGLRYGSDLATARTMAFTNLVTAQLFFVFSCRSEQLSLFRINPFSNVYLILAVFFSFAMHYLVLYIPVLQQLFKTTPLTTGEWALIVIIASSSTFIVEVAQFIINFCQEKLFFVISE
ncbi:calcium-transporting P-type ATPase, PMR1-type [Halanaerobacter jeridensis]|uniref:P-type Ca(2+) transporter n=1 Tax=Halanaerobacter jeridensis TaxID=706427 RepID=A0A939BMG8_9FIRM|nr:calcium-transporting P-type ATPase, PMR1-type [Halanaerobacter jeridensis]MBM7556445.1 Ca2+-transporting ATPase [Halanaerobacter jeridensis]